MGCQLLNEQGDFSRALPEDNKYESTAPHVGVTLRLLAGFRVSPVLFVQSADNKQLLPILFTFSRNYSDLYTRFLFLMTSKSHNSLLGEAPHRSNNKKRFYIFQQQN